MNLTDNNFDGGFCVYILVYSFALVLGFVLGFNYNKCSDDDETFLEEKCHLASSV